MSKLLDVNNDLPLSSIQHVEYNDLPSIQHAEKIHLSIPPAEDNELPSIPPAENNDLPKIHHAENNDLPNIPSAENNDLPSIPPAEDNELPSIPSAENNDLPSIPPAENNDLPNIPPAENNELPIIQHAENYDLPSIQPTDNIPPTKNSDLQSAENNTDVPIKTEGVRYDAIDSKDFQKELMSKILPPSEENINVLADTGVDTNSNLNDQDDEQNTILNRHVEESNGVSNIEDSVSSTLQNPEGVVTGCHDDAIDSKEFQKELMSKVFPLSEGNETAAAAIVIDSDAISNGNEDYQNYLDHINKTVEENADSSESKAKKHKKNKDKDKSKKERKEIKRKSNLVPLDAFFSPTDLHAKKKKIGNENSNVSNVADVKVKEEEMEQNIKEEVKGDLEEGEIDEHEMEDGKIAVKELEEGELRELEEGELPEDIETIDANRDISVITKSIPIDFDDFNRKRKVALLLAYCGAGFHGMQKNPEVETIELRLMEALAAIRAIRPDLKNEFLLNNNNQISFNRAARTDKGVSAARQVVSLKLIANENFLIDVNKQLPKEIRVFGLERVTKTFDAKCSCSGRSYEYLVPTVAFAPTKEIMDSTYRLSDEQFDKINIILRKYLGTHNFHNFTSGKRFSDKSAIRYITDFQASRPFECRGHEFISLEVQGQSFLIHQIRKMIGLCMAICRGYCDVDTVEKSWLEAKLDIPKAPGLGLLLNRVNFKNYNEKYGSDGRHNPLTWENAELEVERYKIEYLWQTIIEEEIKKSSLVHWLKTLNNHTYTEAGMNAPMNSDYKGKKGIFPTLRDKRRFDGAGYDPRREGPPPDCKR